MNDADMSNTEIVRNLDEILRIGREVNKKRLPSLRTDQGSAQTTTASTKPDRSEAAK